MFYTAPYNEYQVIVTLPPGASTDLEPTYFQAINQIQSKGMSIVYLNYSDPTSIAPIIQLRTDDNTDILLVHQSIYLDEPTPTDLDPEPTTPDTIYSFQFNGCTYLTIEVRDNQLISKPANPRDKRITTIGQEMTLKFLKSLPSTTMNFNVFELGLAIRNFC